MQIQIENQTCY